MSNNLSRTLNQPLVSYVINKINLINFQGKTVELSSITMAQLSEILAALSTPEFFRKENGFEGGLTGISIIS